MADDLTPAGRRLDRAALDRVLSRAAELQSSVDRSDASGMLTEEQILELGKEAGLSVDHMRRAMAEERTRVGPPRDRSVLAVLGAATIQASRVVPGRPAELLDAIDGWMRREEGLQLKRRIPDRIVWEARRDLAASFQRAFNVGGRGYALTRAFEIAATATAVDADRSLVMLEGDLSTYRSQLAMLVGLLTGVGALGTAIMTVVNVAIPIALAPLILAPTVTFPISRSAQGQASTRAQLALEQLLDHLERGDHRRPGGLIEAITATAAALQRRR